VRIADRSALEDVRKVLSKDMPKPLADYAPTFFGSPKNHISQEIMDWWVRMMVDECSLYTMLDLHRVFTVTDFRPELPRISVPTLLIHGDIDKSTPRNDFSQNSATDPRLSAEGVRGCCARVADYAYRSVECRPAGLREGLTASSANVRRTVDPVPATNHVYARYHSVLIPSGKRGDYRKSRHGDQNAVFCHLESIIPSLVNM
jgi:hypothetical protein